MTSSVYKSYQEIRAKHPLAFILYRVGEYYFTFDGFALVLSQKTGQPVKTRESDQLIYLAFPASQLDHFITVITKKMDMKLAICDRITLVKRSLYFNLKQTP